MCSGKTFLRASFRQLSQLETKMNGHCPFIEAVCDQTSWLNPCSEIMGQAWLRRQSIFVQRSLSLFPLAIMNPMG
jgi:hypothetical protein